MEEQRRVAAFIAAHDLSGTTEFRLLDLVSEVGEMAKDAAESTGYGESPGDVEVRTDEIGDALFSLLAVAESLDVDASAALDEALEKYEARMNESGTPSSR
jgi:NTP pyrophosphatase (non-canonical NTP hydrolase)